jgi:hypothetical protein
MSKFKCQTLRGHKALFMDQDSGQSDERWKVQVPAVSDLLFIEPIVILRTCVFQRIVLRMICLNQDAAFTLAPARAAGDLRY